MYGVEAGTTGLGGLQATAPAGYMGLGAAMRIRPGGSALIGGPPQNGTVLASQGVGDQVALPIVSASGQSVEHDPSLMLNGWRSILDFHNSPAPWILIAILTLYTWSHLAHGRRGR